MCKPHLFYLYMWETKAYEQDNKWVPVDMIFQNIPTGF